MQKFLAFIIIFIILTPIVLTQTNQTRVISGGGVGSSSRGTGATVFSLADVNKGETIEFRINKDELLVKTISFKAKKNYFGDIKIHLRRTYKFPTKDFPKLSDAHSYFEINTENLNPNLFSNYKIEFYIESLWLNATKINVTNVSLYRYNNGWEELETNFSRKEGHNLFFYTSTPGFSYFSIAKSGLVNKTINNESLPEFTKEVFVFEEIEEIYENPEFEQITEIFQEEIVKKKWQETLVQWGVLLLIVLIFYALSKRKTIFEKTKQKFWHHYNEIIRTKTSPHSVALGFAVGTFISVLPTPGLNIAIGLLIVLIYERINKYSMLLSIFFWNPVTLLPIVYGSLKIGSWIFGSQPVTRYQAEIFNQAFDFTRRYLVGNLILAVVISIASYFIIKFIYKKYVHYKIDRKKK